MRQKKCALVLHLICKYAMFSEAVEHNAKSKSQNTQNDWRTVSLVFNPHQMVELVVKESKATTNYITVFIFYRCDFHSGFLTSTKQSNILGVNI